MNQGHGRCQGNLWAARSHGRHGTPPSLLLRDRMNKSLSRVKSRRPLREHATSAYPPTPTVNHANALHLLAAIRRQNAQPIGVAEATCPQPIKSSVRRYWVAPAALVLEPVTKPVLPRILAAVQPWYSASRRPVNCQRADG
jgi:hypothetical protein